MTEPTHDDVRAEVEQRDKLIATVKARAALAGFELHVVAGPAGRAAFVLARWGWSATLPDVSTVEAVLDRAGAPR